MVKKSQLFRSLLVYFLLSMLALTSSSAVFAATFTPGMAKRNSAGPFASGVLVQGKWDSTLPDTLTMPNGSVISGNFYPNIDVDQGSVVFWITPEWNGNDNKDHYILRGSTTGSLDISKNSTDSLIVGFRSVANMLTVDVSSWTAGTTYAIVVRWDSKSKIDGTNYVGISINDTHTFGRTTSWSAVNNTSTTYYVGSDDIGNKPANAIIEGLTIYRRPLFDGTYGIDVGNGDEINQIYNAGAGKDPTLVTGSWDVVFALPTNASTGALATGTANAWSHPHSSNLLYTSTTNTGGFMMGADSSTDGWSEVPWYKVGGSGGVVAAYQPIGASSLGNSYINIANPGTYDAIPGVAPTLVSGGWQFNGTAQYVYNNYYLAGPGYSNCMLIRFTGSANNGYVAGSQNSSAGAYYAIAPQRAAGSAVRYIFGGTILNTGTGLTDGVLGINNSTGYRNGVNDGYIGTWTGSGQKIVIGASNFNNSGGVSPTAYWNGTVNAFAIYSTQITEAQLSTVTSAMQNLSSSGTYLTPVALASTEKIFAGGYKYTSNGGNQGIYRSFTATNGGDYVLRAMGHSDGTCNPQIKITRADGTTEITHLNGTTSSTRTAPNVYIFTWESPAAESEQVQLINTASSGTCYWHQVEVLDNLIDKPSLETGSGNPWIPTGWGNGATEVDGLVQELSDVHSGSSSLKWQSPLTVNHGINRNVTVTSGAFYSFGLWHKDVGSSGPHAMEIQSWGRIQNSSTISYFPFQGTAWQHYGGVIRATNSGSVQSNLFLRNPGTVGVSYSDDIYNFPLSDISLTITPASEANSTENTDEIRVDGGDTYVASSGEAVSLGTSSGYVSFDYRPRHSASNMLSFGESTPYIVSLYGDANDYVNVYWDANNSVTLAYSMNGTTGSGTWNATGAIVGGSQYTSTLTYTGSGTMVLSVGGTDRITLSSIPAAFGTAPNTVYFGSTQPGASQGDATYSALVFDNTAPSISLTALTPDPNSDNTPTVSGTATEAIGTVSSVQYQMDSTAGSWSACTATDGSFNSASEAFSCTAATLSDGVHTINVRATDSSGNTTANGSVSTDTFTIDVTAPTGGSITYTDSYHTTTSVVLTVGDGTDTTSGVNTSSRTVQRKSATLSAGNCGTYGSFSTITPSGTYPSVTDSTVVSGNCYQYQYLVSDNATNQATYTTSNVVKVDTVAPTTPGTPATTSPTADTTPSWSWSASTDTSSGLASPAYTVEWSTSASFASGVVSTTATTTSFTHVTPLTDGTWYIRVKATDGAGNNSAHSATSSVQINTGAPTGSVSINSGADYTKITAVTLTLSASSGFFSGTGNIQMKLSNLADLSDASYEAFASTKAWTLPTGDGTKTVYVQFKDSTNNESGAYTDTIGLDTVVPNSFELTNPSNHAYTHNERPSFKWKAASTPDATSGLSKYKLEVDNGETGDFTIDSISPSRTTTDDTNQYTVAYENFADFDTTNNYISLTTKSSVLWGLGQNDGKLKEGKRSWQVVAVDNAGNERAVDRTLFVDRTSPSVTVTQLNERKLTSTTSTTNAVTTSDTTPTLYGAITDPLAGNSDSSVEQVRTDNQVSSGPKSVVVQVEKKTTQGTYELLTLSTLNLTQQYWTKDGTIITDNTQNTASKFSTFEYLQKESLSSGSYRFKLAGADSDNNQSSDTLFYLTVGSYQIVATPTQQTLVDQAIEEVISQELPAATQAQQDQFQQAVTQDLEVTNTAMPINPSLWERFRETVATADQNMRQGVGSTLATLLQTLGMGIRATGATLAQELTTASMRVSQTADQAEVSTTDTVTALTIAVGKGAGALSNTAGLALMNAGAALVTEPTAITNVAVTILSPTSAQVTWTTNQPANGKINWGLAAGEYPFESQTEQRSTAHQFMLTNLTPNTDYHFEVMSHNKNYVYDANRQFRTPPEVAAEPANSPK